jgi:hypothetical protein
VTKVAAPMLAYHGQQEIKSHYLARVQAHREADEIVQGYGYWQDGKGCAVGCTIHGSDHASYETELGVPRALAHLEDQLFESMPVKEARQWPERFLAAIQPGADLSRVAPRVLLRMQRRNRDRVSGLADVTDALRAQVVAVIEGAIAVLTEWADTGECPEEAARSAAWAAESEGWAARSAAESAAWAAESAESEILQIADDLIAELSAAPVVQ